MSLIYANVSEVTDGYHDMKGLLLVPGAFLKGFGVKLGGWVPLELRLEDVAAHPVGQEAALVQVHLFAGCLEVQGHCKGSGCI